MENELKTSFLLKIALFAILVPSAVGQSAATEHFDRGNERNKMGDVRGAVAEYTKAIELDPAFAPAFVERGELMAKGQTYAEAIADFSKAIELGSTSYKAFAGQGIFVWSNAAVCRIDRRCQPSH